MRGAQKYHLIMKVNTKANGKEKQIFSLRVSAKLRKSRTHICSLTVALSIQYMLPNLYPLY